jgi:transposase, IS5 family
MREGTTVYATIIAAPASTKNKQKARDPDMQTKKGSNWSLGITAHVGANTDSSLVQSLKVTAANESDVARAADVLHGQESTAYADAG